MFSVSEVASISQDSPIINKFKPWFEQTIDFLVLGLFLVGVVCWTRIIVIEAQGVVCVTRNRSSEFGYWDMKYASNRCGLETHQQYLLSYPYVLMLQCVLALFVQTLWLKVPEVWTKFTAFHEIFNSMLSIKPDTDLSPYTNHRTVPEVEFCHSAREALKVLHGRLTYLLSETSLVSKVYRVKVFSMIVLSIAGLVYMTVSAFMFWSTHMNFECQLLGYPNRRAYPPLVCNFMPGAMLFVIVSGHFLMVTFILLLSLYSVFWLWLRRSFAESAGLFGSMADYYSGLPGHQDLQLMMALIFTNISDGHRMFQVIKACLQVQAREMEEVATKGMSRPIPGEVRYKQDSELARKQDELILKSKEEHCVIKYVINTLSLEETTSVHDPSHLLECILTFPETMSVSLVMTVSTLRSMIVDEIESHPRIYKLLIDKNPSTTSYEVYVRRMRDSNSFGDQFFLMAAARLFRMRIVVIASSTSQQNVFSPYATTPGNVDMFKDINVPTRFLTLYRPWFYRVAQPVQVHSMGALEADHLRKRYTFEQSYRRMLHKAALRSAMVSLDRKEKPLSVIPTIPDALLDVSKGRFWVRTVST